MGKGSSSYQRFCAGTYIPISSNTPFGPSPPKTKNQPLIAMPLMPPRVAGMGAFVLQFPVAGSNTSSTLVIALGLRTRTE